MMLPPTQTLFFEDLSLGMTETYVKEVKSSDVVGFAEAQVLEKQRLGGRQYHLS